MRRVRLATGRASGSASIFSRPWAREGGGRRSRRSRATCSWRSGPGSGALTFPLAESGAPILAVEIDRDLVAEPRTAAAAQRHGRLAATSSRPMCCPISSGLETAAPGGGTGGHRSRAGIAVVGNLPYNLSTPILFRLIELQQRHGVFADATIMLQREVADRLVASPGRKDYGVLTVLLGLHASVTRLLDLPPGAFRPAPKVRSAVVRPRIPAGRRPHRRPGAVRDAWSSASSASGGRRSPTPSRDSSRRPRPSSTAAAIDPRRRPETLTLAELARLADRRGRRAAAGCAIVSPVFPPVFGSSQGPMCRALPASRVAPRATDGRDEWWFGGRRGCHARCPVRLKLE